MRLCRAEQAVIYRQEEGTYRFVAGHSTVPDYLDIEKETVILPGKGTVVGRAALTEQVARIDDAWNDRLYKKKRDAKIGGVRSMIGVPLLREGKTIGVIALARNRVEPCTPQRRIRRYYANRAQCKIRDYAIDCDQANHCRSCESPGDG
jgi:GAF domain-containing protein